MLHKLAALLEFREKFAHAVSQHIDELVEKRFLKTQRAPIPHSAPKDAAQHVIAIVVAWQNAVGNGEAQRADMIADHAEGDVDLFLFVRFAVRQCGGVSFAAELFEFSKNGTEDVRVVIGNRLGEVGEVLRGLNDGGHALEAHAGIHMFGGQWREGAVFVGVVLNENEVPNFYALAAVGVYKAAFGIALGSEVNVQFAARAARAGVAHHPEVILLVTVDNMHGGIKAGGGEDLRPIIVCLLIEFTGIAIARFVHRGVQTLFRETPRAGDQFPGPFDGFLFEIITKGPVAQHLEKRVVIGIHPHIFEVVVFAAGANTLLRVSGAPRRVRAVLFAEKDRHKLVHAGVGEQQVWRIGHEAGRGHDGVLAGLKEIEKVLPDLSAGA